MLSKNLRYTVCALCACIALLAFTATPANGQGSTPISGTVVISQVYGGGGNSGSTYKNDFVELHNVGNVPAVMSNWSVQYASAAGSSWQVTSFSGTIPVGGYFLVQEAQGSGGTTSLPTPDATGTIAMGASAGKIALVNNITALTGACPTGTAIVDFVGFGTTANCYEGTGPTPAPSNTNAVLRAGDGWTETGNNAADFSAGAPNPRNTQTVITGSVTVTVAPSFSLPGTSVNISVAVLPPVLGTTVVGDLTAIGGSPTQAFAEENGGRTFTFTANLPSDLAAGKKTVTITVGGATPTSSTTADIMVVATHEIHDVQGNGDASPLVGEGVQVSGIVTGLVYNGFYLQAADDSVDSDAATSEGVFVYTGSAPTVVVGDEAQVAGIVQEYRPTGAPLSTTEIASSPMVTVVGHGDTLPATTDIVPDPSGAIDQFERYEGMLVRLASPQVTGPTGVSSGKSNGVFYVTSSDLPRPFRQPGVEPGIALPAGMPANYPRFDGNPERVKVDSSNCATPANVGVGDAVPDLSGPLGYTGDFTIYACPVATSTLVAQAVAPRAANEFTVATFNMLNFTNNANRIAKASKAILEKMGAPDVIGVEEMLDLTTLQALAEKINGDLGSTVYAASLTPASGSQNVGFLYRTDRLSNISIVQVGADVLMPDNKNVVNDRPPLVMTAQVKPDSGAGYPVTIIVNHLRSLIDVDTVSPTGDFARTKRQWGAEYLANLIAQHQAAGEKVIAIGDFNAYEFNDGYVDVLGTVTGDPSAADQVLLASADLLTPNAIDLITTLPANQRYTYVENGNAQAIDHVVVTQNLLKAPYRLLVVHNNADFPGLLANDYTRAERVSDHDMPVAYFTLPPSADGVTPTGGSGDSTFAFTFSDRAGYTALGQVQAIIGAQATYAGVCGIKYTPGSNLLYLTTDGGGWSGPVAPGAATTLSNSQCVLNAAGSSVSGSGVQLTLNLALTFAATFTGQQNIYGFAIDAVAQSDWQKLGTWTTREPIFVPQAVAPTVDSVSPNGATGATQNLAFQFSSVNGSSYIDWVQGIINGSVSYQGGCVFYYLRPANRLYLMNDAGAAWLGPVSVGTAGTVSNTKCSIDAGASAVAENGNTLTLTLAVTGTPLFVDVQRIYAYASDHGGLRSGWMQIGTWTPNVPVATPPTVVGGSSDPGTASLTVSDVNGAGYISWIQAIIGTNYGYAGGCNVYYLQQSNRLYLMNDAGTAWLGPVYPGQFGTLSNLQCSINAKNTRVTTSGTDLTLSLSWIPTAAFLGERKAWAIVSDNANRNSTWVFVGPINVR